MNHISRSMLRVLCSLRWLGVAGQAMTVVLVTGPLGLTLFQVELWWGIAALLLFNVYATWRAWSIHSPSQLELYLHMLVDVAALTWLIAWSGGADNPFSSLFLLPIALAVLALSPAWVWATAAACLLGYGISAFFGAPLPNMHSSMGDTFALHKIGMAANFLVSAVVILLFLQRMLTVSRRSEHELYCLRERFARNEGILALATHAASVAHELNTPLVTLTLMVEDSLRVAPPGERKEDLMTMMVLLEQCRDRVRELAKPADPKLQGSPTPMVNLDQVIERWQLVRPAIELRRSGSIRGFENVEPAVGHLLQVLLNNAADASEQAGTLHIDLELSSDCAGLRGEIRDYGLGFAAAAPMLPKLFETAKPRGMGVGLALSHATVERLGGELSIQASDACGTRVAFRLPAGVAA